MYKKYLKYILKHKKNVFLECWNRAINMPDLCFSERIYLIIHGIFHDISKFSLSEFVPYAQYFYGNYPLSKDVCKNYEGLTYEKVEENFNKAWEKHYKRNKHHWNYWTVKRKNDIFANYKCPSFMSKKYLLQMFCDLGGMSREFHDTPQEYYLKNYYKIRLHRDSRIIFEELLGLVNADILNIVDSEYFYMRNQYTLEELFTEKIINIDDIKKIQKNCLNKYNIDLFDIFNTNDGLIIDGELMKILANPNSLEEKNIRVITATILYDVGYIFNNINIVGDKISYTIDTKINDL